MIRCKLVQYSEEDATQTTARVGRAVSGETLSLGRAAACKIFLPDPRVRLEHASIRRAEDGSLYLEAIGPVFVNQRAETGVRLAVGQKITIGPYDFVVEALLDGADHPDSQLTMSYAQRASAQAEIDKAHARGGVGVTSGWITRRRLSWLFGLAVLALAGAWPVWHAFQPPPPLTLAAAASPHAAAAQKMPAPAPAGESDLQSQMLRWIGSNGTRLDTFWNPGPLASAHQTFAQDCRACHDKPFQRVTDDSCKTCHKDTGDHVANAQVAHNTLLDQRCATCHKEHQGPAGMRTTDTVGCAQCHGSIRTYSALTTLGNVSDFAKEHPAFRLSIRQADLERTVVRTPQTAQLKNETGLKFNHAQHLDKAGIKSPKGPAATGGRVVLECASCHTLDAAEVRYAPVRMDKHCQACHRLSVDPQAPEREVLHAKPAQVEVAVREVYASLAVDRFPVSLITVNTLLQRPTGKAPASRSTQAARWVQEESRKVMKTMFETPKGVCKTCHDIQPDPAPESKASPWLISPIVETHHWLPGSRFSHAQHKNAECTACHKAQDSKLASDILIPDIASCRTCHAGEKPEQDKIVSRCDSCHGFHPKTEHPAFKQTVAATGVRP